MTLTTVLFVGGLSRRMGVDKATLDVLGEPLWRKQVKLLRELQPQSLFISARERPAWCTPDLAAVLDEPPSRGPLSGLVAALGRLQTSHLLVLAIDLPKMSADELRKLLALARPGCGVIPMSGEHFEPLCAIYPAEALAVATQALAGDDVSLQTLARTLVSLHLLQAHVLSEIEKPLFLNVNSPADLRALQRTV